MPNAPAEPASGYAYGIAAYSIWGLVLPLYMKALAHVPSMEVMAQRVLWSWVLTLGILAFGTGLAGLRAARSPRVFGTLVLTALLISVNWGVYVWAIATGHGLDAALGYYINPLINVVMAAVFLRERLTRLQTVAVGIAATGVIVLTIESGGLPWVSLALALSFASYGLLRKTVKIGATEGFFLEVTILFLPALALAIWLVRDGGGHFGIGTTETALLVGTGVVTAVPMILFSAAARLLRYTTVGLLQYIAPTLITLTAIFIFGEPFGVWQAVAFGCIWSALALYSYSIVRGRRVAAEEVVAVEPVR
ncbi:EamA family transporter RarD [Aureimonas sp. Leaf324]|jgi:chloramphenicol-sensitive protein RarD|uniref:EamA family transporter RarD n=1 Tax=Aureimonas sp. Leaf324 TaxID=1736336 RepID=UPI0006F66852|nr:EamA family transporter RarD [Aureimonas sp. Leaf324]KQQ85794.1 permease [Aureimonas sp. Leaf324]